MCLEQYKFKKVNFKIIQSTLTLLFLCLFFTTKAQETEKIPELSRFNFKVNVAIPTIVSNKALRNSFRGIYDAGANLQLRLFKGVYLGVLGNYTGFKIAGDKIALLNTECRTATSGLNLGYEKFSSPRIMWYVNIAAGYNWINYSKIQCTDSIHPVKNFQAWSYRPSAGFTYYSDNNFSLGLYGSYTILMNQFNADNLCLQDFGTFRASDSKGNTNYFSIGIVLNFNLRKDLFIGSEESDAEEEN